MGAGASSIARLRKALVIKSYNLRKQNETVDDQFSKYSYRGKDDNQLYIRVGDIRECLGLQAGEHPWIEAVFQCSLGEVAAINYHDFIRFLESGKPPVLSPSAGRQVGARVLSDARDNDDDGDDDGEGDLFAPRRAGSGKRKGGGVRQSPSFSPDAHRDPLRLSRTQSGRLDGTGGPAEQDSEAEGGIAFSSGAGAVAGTADLRSQKGDASSDRGRRKAPQPFPPFPPAGAVHDSSSTPGRRVHVVDAASITISPAPAEPATEAGAARTDRTDPRKGSRRRGRHEGGKDEAEADWATGDDDDSDGAEEAGRGELDPLEDSAMTVHIDLGNIASMKLPDSVKLHYGDTEVPTVAAGEECLTVTVIGRGANELQQQQSPKPLWRKRETVRQERTVHYTTMDADGALQELVERETTQQEVLHMECRDTGEFAHRETTQYEQLETFNEEVVNEVHGAEEYVHLKSLEDEFHYMESTMPPKPCEHPDNADNADNADNVAQAEAGSDAGVEVGLGKESGAMEGMEESEFQQWREQQGEPSSELLEAAEAYEQQHFQSHAFSAQEQEQEQEQLFGETVHTATEAPPSQHEGSRNPVKDTSIHSFVDTPCGDSGGGSGGDSGMNRSASYESLHEID